MRGKLLGTIALVLAVSAAQAQQPRAGGGLMACRADMEALCGSDKANRPKVRQCIIENRDKVSEDCKRALDMMRNGPGAGAMPTATVSYGNDARQAIDFYRAKGAAAPLIVFIHGGAWSLGDKRQASGRKPGHFTGAGYAFASINYRLVPQATVEQQAADVASAIDMLRFRAEEYGIDPNRIALMGHSAGAHLAALVATDPQYLKAADVPMKAVKAVVLLDGAGYDVAAQMKTGGPVIQKLYGPAFGNDPRRQAALSPMSHTAPPNAAAWLALYVEGRDASLGQSQALVKALEASGVKARALAVPESSHSQLNQNLGMDGDAATAEVDAFLKAAL
ncbi:alpha/beta hydrolase [Sphingosinicella soli]|uniref:Acetyl esterase/lipase n=1 Tax=Sphingosinicella soli TaxID=333708 RepID=A0A7W7B485_9SPHN|nr:alpha/beta hydrolase [Sphingosinicella soli]MBB4633731.1 acetyl esterase/lipase [Sphingosinicella soli]